MMMTVINVLKAGCLVLYGLALAAFLGQWPGAVGNAMQMLALVFLVAHLLELVVAFDKVRLYDGPLAASAALTLLFGLLHWWPLARQHSNKGNNNDKKQGD